MKVRSKAELVKVTQTYCAFLPDFLRSKSAKFRLKSHVKWSGFETAIMSQIENVRRERTWLP